MNDIKPFFDNLGGIAPVVGESLVPMSIHELMAIETNIGSTLPETYRSFLQEYGATTFNEIVQFNPVQPLPSFLSGTGKGLFNYFLGAASTTYGNHLWLSRAISTYNGRMPEGIIPIADDSGNKICIGINGSERGKVYYWDHNNEWDEEDYLEEHRKPMPPGVKFQNVYLIAESFEDFVKRLEKLED